MKETEPTKPTKSKDRTMAILPISVGWTPTGDELGHLPKFDIRCRTRKLNPETGNVEDCDTPMFMRHSTVGIRDDFDVGINIICYKCPACDWFITFEVRRPKEEIKGILDMRSGKKKLIPKDMWLTHDEEELIRQKLEVLGYV